MTTPTSSLVALARWSSAVRLADIPLAVQVAAKRCLIDTLGVGLAGSRSAVASQARALSGITAASGYSSVLGDPQSLNPAAAAFINGTASHALDFDDNSYPGFVHGSAVIMPAALAVAQMRGLDGAGLLSAFVVGAECEYALARALTREIYDRGWWTTGVLGVVGACAAASHALGLGREQTAAALGIALSGTGGMKATFGTDAKMIMTGRASEAGVIAALLAAQGCRGPLDIIEHSQGLAAMFNGGLLLALPTLGTDWSLLSPGVDIKRWPVCLSSHAAIDALRELLDRTAVAVQDIEQIVCDVPPIVMQNLTHHLPTQRQQAQFSMPFAMACTCLLGDITLAHLNEETINRSDMQQLMRRVRMHSSERWQPSLLESAPEGAWVKVVLQDGSAVEVLRSKPLGSVDNPLSRQQLHDKFMGLATQVLPTTHAQTLLNDLEQLEHQPRVRDLPLHALTLETT